MAAIDDLLKQLGAAGPQEQPEAAANLPAAVRRLKQVASPVIGVGAGVAAGALQNPLVRAAAEPLRQMQQPLVRPGATEAEVEAAQLPSVAGQVRTLQARYGDEPGFETFEFVGKYAPDVIGAAKIVGASRRLGEWAMEKSASRIAARLNPARKGTLASQTRALAAYAENKAGALLPTSAPAAYRVGQGAANVLGGGAFFGVHSAAEGNDPGTIASDALQGALWTLGAEAGFAAIGPVVSKYAQRVNLSEAVEHYVWSKAPQAAQDARRGLGKGLKRSAADLARARTSLEARRQVLDLASEMEGQVSGRVARYGTSPVVEAEARVAKAEGLVKQRGTKAAQKAHAFETFNREFVFGPITPSALTRTTPIKEGGGFTMGTRLALLKSPFPLLAITPQAFAGKLGVTGVRAYQALGRSEAEFQTAWARKHDEALGFWKEAREIMGERGAKNGQFFRPVGHAWEQGGAEQVLREFPEQGPQLVNLLQRMKVWREELRAPAVKMGAEPNLSDAEKAALGVKEYWPHVFRDLDDAEAHSMLVSGLKKRLARENPTWTATRVEMEAKSLATKSNRYPNDKLSSVGSLDKTRYAPGTLSEKADDGMPFIEDYFESMIADARSVVRRSAYAKRWGWDAELSNEVVKLVAAEGGSETMMRAVLDGFFKTVPARAGWRKAAQVLTTAQVGAKMTFAALPNMGQSANTVGVYGIENTWRGLQGMLKAENIQRLDHQAATLDGMFQALRATEFGGYQGHDWLQRLVDIELKLNLFTPSEHVNRILGASTAAEMARSTLSKAALGKLRGNNLDFARRQFAKMDANLDDMVARLRAGQSLDPLEVDIMVYRGAQLTQFMPDITRRPFGWNTPLGRVLSQFNNFVLGQTNFLRHEVIAEASRGNYAPLATLAVVYPTTGELIGGALEYTGRERPERGLERWVDRLALSGALGMVYQLYTGARYGSLAETALGPTGGTVARLGAASWQSAAREDWEPLQNYARSLPVARAALLFRDPAEWTLDNFDKFERVLGESNEATEVAPTLDELRYQRAYGKQAR